ncbi:polysaccharide biosynthesis protein [Pseudonocardia sp.]
MSPVAFAALDGAAWTVGLLAAVWARNEWELSSHSDGGGAAVTSVLIVVAVQIAVGLLVRLYRGRFWVGSLEEAKHLGAAVLCSGAVLLAVSLTTSGLTVTPSVVLTATLLTVLICETVRVLVRRGLESAMRAINPDAERVIVFGAGEAGRQLTRSMLFEPGSRYLPVAFIDDDRRLRGRTLSGVTVLGSREDIETVAATVRADLLVIAVPSAGPEATTVVARAAMEAGLSVKVLPPLAELVESWVGFTDLRDINITDLLGRRPVETDVAAIADRLHGRRVLVTGAGGSIGSELCRQIHRFDPAELIMLDRDESALHSVQLSIHGRALLDSPDVVLADIRDAVTMRTIFERRRPHIVFHAAALKHLPMLEQYPDEAWKTNVIGTQNVLDAAVHSGVETFVNVSTDKAANPISVLGRSKRFGERLVASVSRSAATGTYLSVRFGNVLGSRGSVLMTFADQIASGRPLTITHPEVTRFFMTIPEAVELVIQAAAIGRQAEALVLDMGDPIRIVDVAHQLMELAGRQTQIVYTGLRQGEKLHEELFGDGERDVRPHHPAISHVDVPPLEPELVSSLWTVVDPSEAMERASRTVAATPVTPHEAPIVPAQAQLVLTVPAEPPLQVISGQHQTERAAQ